MNLLERIFANLRWPDPKSTEGILIEDQIGVLQAIAKEPGSVIPFEDPPRAGDRPIRFRTVRRLVELDQLWITQADHNNNLYLTLTARGWDRITVKLDP